MLSLSHDELVLYVTSLHSAQVVGLSGGKVL